MEGSPDSTPSGLQRWGASRWANCLATVLTPIIISQTWLQRPTDSQTSQSSGRTEQQSAAILRRQDQSRSQLCTANGINLCWNGTRVKRVGGYRDRRWWGTKRRCSLYSCYHDYQASIPQQMEEKIFLLEKLSIWTIWKPWTPDWEHTGETRFFLFFLIKALMSCWCWVNTEKIHSPKRFLNGWTPFSQKTYLVFWWRRQRAL